MSLSDFRYTLITLRKGQKGQSFRSLDDSIEEVSFEIVFSFRIRVNQVEKARKSILSIDGQFNTSG